MHGVYKCPWSRRSLATVVRFGRKRSEGCHLEIVRLGIWRGNRYENIASMYTSRRPLSNTRARLRLGGCCMVAKRDEITRHATTWDAMR